MEAICSSEISVDFKRITRRYIPEDRTPHNHRCENLKSYLGQRLEPKFYFITGSIYFITHVNKFSLFAKCKFDVFRLMALFFFASLKRNNIILIGKMLA
jgi:hypothetical protein